MNILEELAASTALIVEEAKQNVSEDDLCAKIKEIDETMGRPLNPFDTILKNTGDNNKNIIAVAAEFKRASPSKGEFAMQVNLNEQISQYVAGNASVISVLTEPTRFKGSLSDLLNARKTVNEVTNNTPSRPMLLRKDFILDRYQLLEARAYGADTALLIVAMLSKSVLQTLIVNARELGMEPLVEVNNEEELGIALEVGSKWIGVNNRDLKTFKLDLDTTVRVANALKKSNDDLFNNIILFALSGISSRNDVTKFLQCGAHGILVGESLMRSTTVVNDLRYLRTGDTRRKNSVDGSLLHHHLPPLVKLCGMTRAEDVKSALQAGADLIGIICAKGSSRTVTMDVAKEIASTVQAYGERSGRIEKWKESASTPSSLQGWYGNWASEIRHVASHTPLLVGVFKDQSVSEINEIATQVGLDLVQLHGDEGYDICKDIVCPVIRVLHVPEYLKGNAVDAVAIIDSVKAGFAAALLLDTATTAGKKGGTGATFDWRIAAEFYNAKVPTFIAGGLTPSNVALSIHKSRPFGVDTSSGVEGGETKGVKKVELLKSFVNAAKGANETGGLSMILQEEED